ncbi:hypothetical protein GBA52_015896 [Prunus armeniaca]|nr:hypothetical protein GBA52_015896 [Prunus armeniaca]
MKETSPLSSSSATSDYNPQSQQDSKAGVMSVLQQAAQAWEVPPSNQEEGEHCYNNNQGVTNYALPTNTTSHLDPIPVDQKSKGIYAKSSTKTAASISTCKHKLMQLKFIPRQGKLSTIVNYICCQLVGEKQG